MSPFSPAVIGGGFLLASPALYQALVAQTLALDVALIRLLVAIAVSWIALSVVVEFALPKPQARTGAGSAMAGSVPGMAAPVSELAGGDADAGLGAGGLDGAGPTSVDAPGLDAPELDAPGEGATVSGSTGSASAGLGAPGTDAGALTIEDLDSALPPPPASELPDDVGIGSAQA